MLPREVSWSCSNKQVCARECNVKGWTGPMDQILPSYISINTSPLSQYLFLVYQSTPPRYLVNTLPSGMCRPALPSLLPSIGTLTFHHTHPFSSNSIHLFYHYNYINFTHILSTLCPFGPSLCTLITQLFQVASQYVPNPIHQTLTGMSRTLSIKTLLCHNLKPYCVTMYSHPTKCF